MKNKENTDMDDKPEGHSSAEISNEKEKQKRRSRIYTNEDLLFMADEKTTIKDIVKKFGFDTARQAIGARSYARRIFGISVARKYTDEDIKFMADEKTTTEDILERFGFTKPSQAYGARTYAKKVLGIQTPKNSKRARVPQKYTDEDIKFLADEKTTSKEIMEKFELDELRQAHGARTYARKILGIRKPTTSKPDRKPIKYTDEDRAFLLDKKNKPKDIMERFGFTEPQQAYKARVNAKIISGVKSRKV